MEPGGRHSDRSQRQEQWMSESRALTGLFLSVTIATTLAGPPAYALVGRAGKDKPKPAGTVLLPLTPKIDNTYNQAPAKPAAPVAGIVPVVRSPHLPADAPEESARWQPPLPAPVHAVAAPPVPGSAQR